MAATVEGGFSLDEATCQLKGYWDKEIETRLSLNFFMGDKKIHFWVTVHGRYTSELKWEYLTS